MPFGCSTRMRLNPSVNAIDPSGASVSWAGPPLVVALIACSLVVGTGGKRGELS